MSVYGPYPGRYSLHMSPSIRSYHSYAPSRAYTSSVYTHNLYSRSLQPQTGVVSEKVYFSFNGKLIRSFKIRSYTRAQKHVLDLFPDMLQGIASSRIQFYVTRAGYSGRGYVGFKSYISKEAWAAEIDNLAEHETVVVEVRPSVSFSETVSSFLNRTRVL